MWKLEDTFYADEDIVNKIQYIHNLTSQSHYVGWHGQPPNYIQRVETALTTVPEKYHAAALALFANVIYLPRSLLDEAWRETALELQFREGWTPNSGFEDALFLAVHDPGLVTTFTRIVGVRRREDPDVNPGWGTVSKFIDALVTFVWAKGQDLATTQNIRLARNKKWWILLTDNAISGSSAKNDIELLQSLKRILCDESMTSHKNRQPKILLCAQTITEQALQVATSMLSQDEVFYGIKFDDSFRVNSSNCALFRERSTLLKVQELCEWFGDTYFLPYADGHFENRLKLHRKKGGRTNYAYGWRDGGYTIVTQENCPSNSVPLLSYTPSPADRPLGLRYTPPFPRFESRESHSISESKANAERLASEDNVATIRQGIAQPEEVN